MDPSLTDERLDGIFCNDSSDDCYITLDGTMEEGKDTYMCAHSHPDVKWVFPARMKIPDDVRSRLEECLDAVRTEN